MRGGIWACRFIFNVRVYSEKDVRITVYVRRGGYDVRCEHKFGKF
jgi:hypothetical protein